mgnify:CR=1 FL=1
MISMTVDEALRPGKMTCIKCGGELKVFPCPIPQGIGFCHTCSPAWLESFATYLMNQERKGRGLKSV